jgi:hypothetical protein
MMTRYQHYESQKGSPAIYTVRRGIQFKKLIVSKTTEPHTEFMRTLFWFSDSYPGA